MNSKIIWIVFKKELKDAFRDKKTVMLSILIPLLIFPIMFYFMGKTTKSTEEKVQSNFKIAVTDEGNSSLGKFLKDQKDLKISDNASEEDVKNGKVYASIIISKDFDDAIKKENTGKIKVVFDNSSQQSQIAIGKVNNYINQFNQTVIAERLNKRNINTAILKPTNIETQTVNKENEGMGKLILTLLLPMLLLVNAVSAPMGAAIEEGAGEKERGTLEPLLTTQASRMSLLWGKFFATTFLGFMTVIASIIGILFSMFKFGDAMGGSGNGGSINLSVLSILFIGLIGILITMVFGALELSISIYARSFKEAQTYLTPLSLIVMVPAFGTYLLDAKNIDGFYFHIPLANAACLMKESIVGIFNPVHIAITLSWMLIYIVASILFARFMFSREEVIFRN